MFKLCPWGSLLLAPLWPLTFFSGERPRALWALLFNSYNKACYKNKNKHFTGVGPSRDLNPRPRLNERWSKYRLQKDTTFLEPCHTRAASLQYSHSVQNTADNRVVRVVQSRTTLGGDHFEHARRQRRGLAFAQRACSHCQVYNHVRPGLDTGSSRDHNYTIAFIVLCVISTFCSKSTDCPIYLQIYSLAKRRGADCFRVKKTVKQVRSLWKVYYRWTRAFNHTP